VLDNPQGHEQTEAMPIAQSSSADFLRIEDLQVHFTQKAKGWGSPPQVIKAVDGVSLNLAKGEILGLVGESGCGKSTLSRAVLQLIPPTAGSIILEGQNLSQLSPKALRTARLNFQMVFQDPYASLNPRLTIFSTLLEALQTRGRIPQKQRATAVAQLMERVGLESRFMLKYPHEFSGGQRQRIAIARALAPNPELLIADEPVSALDVSIQSQIINLLLQLSREMNLTMLFISHDLSVVRFIADRIAVMQGGKIVELGAAEEVYDRPQHPYTQKLLSAVLKPMAG
jgi:oligopeptide transport system ATP-binding protein